MIRELKDVRDIPQLKKNVILVGAFEVQCLRLTLEEGIPNMSNGSLLVLKGIRRNILYYLKGSAVTENLASSECLDCDSTRL